VEERQLGFGATLDLRFTIYDLRVGERERQQSKNKVSATEYRLPNTDNTDY
jgi:hypothetical protein